MYVVIHELQYASFKLDTFVNCVYGPFETEKDANKFINSKEYDEGYFTVKEVSSV